MDKPIEREKKIFHCSVSWSVFSPCRSEVSLGAASTSSLRGTVRVARCECREQDTWECLVASPSLSHTYLMWLEMAAGGTALASPPLSLQPADVGKQRLTPWPWKTAAGWLSWERGHRQDRKSSLIPVWAPVQTTLSRAQAVSKLVISDFFHSNQDVSVPGTGPVSGHVAEDLNYI